MHFPRLTPTPQRRVTTERFTGYDHRLRIADGAFYDTRNLSSRDYPLLCTRPRRGTVRTLDRPQGLIAKDALATVENGTLYIAGHPTAVTGLGPGEKQLVSMGATILIFPDKRYYNTEDPSDYGFLEAEYRSSGTVEYSLCDSEGRDLPAPQVSDTEPEEPVNGALWLDTASGGRVLLQYSEAQGLWAELDSVFTRLRFQSLGALPGLFNRHDGVSLSGAPVADLNGEKILYALGGSDTERDYIVIAGVLESPGSFTEGLTIRRSVPDMDYVCEAGNRLWGCRYGHDGEQTLNEIYASALGDYKNFRQYLGLSTDSWTASVGSDGVFTGAVNYLGRPCFFKEDRVHVVTISSTGAHRLEETACRGVQKGSGRSLCVVGESLYYKAIDCVCQWQGGFPRPVSLQLGEQRFTEAAAGALGSRYYLSMKGEDGAYAFFCCDTERGLWYREDSLRARHFAALEGELYAIDEETGTLLALLGTAGEAEASLPWMAETGLLHYRSSDRKYLSRYNLSLRMEPGSSLRLWIRYDSEGEWQAAGELQYTGTGTVTLPVRPRRCDHLQLRLEGEGEMRLFALTRVLEIGSDL